MRLISLFESSLTFPRILSEGKKPFSSTLIVKSTPTGIFTTAGVTSFVCLSLINIFAPDGLDLIVIYVFNDRFLKVLLI